MSDLRLKPMQPVNLPKSNRNLDSIKNSKVRNSIDINSELEENKTIDQGNINTDPSENFNDFRKVNSCMKTNGSIIRRTKKGNTYAYGLKIPNEFLLCPPESAPAPRRKSSSIRQNIELQRLEKTPDKTNGNIIQQNKKRNTYTYGQKIPNEFLLCPPELRRRSSSIRQDLELQRLEKTPDKTRRISFDLDYSQNIGSRYDKMVQKFLNIGIAKKEN